MEHYALTVLKAEKARLEYELFEIEKFNQSVLPHRMIWEFSQDIYIHPSTVNRIREKLKEINEAIEWMEGKKIINNINSFDELSEKHGLPSAFEKSLSDIHKEGQ